MTAMTACLYLSGVQSEWLLAGPFKVCACQAAPHKVVFPSALTLCPPPPSDPWLGDKLTVFHQKRGVSLILLVMREVEGDGDIAAVCCWTLASTCTRGEC